MSARVCSRVGCSQSARATLTYDYADAMVVVGPLSVIREPHGYDLCAEHSTRLTAPQGWRVVRYLPPETEGEPAE